MRTCSFRLQIAGATAMALLCSVAPADEPTDFYQGKSITLYLGYPPGGAYDLHAGAIARHMSRHMAGHPQFVVRHKPGAPSAALRQVFERPLRDPEFLAAADRLALEVDLSPVRHCKPWWNACLAPPREWLRPQAGRSDRDDGTACGNLFEIGAATGPPASDITASSS